MASRGHLGGLSWTTPQALRVLDAAGCDVILVETVGVGQSEVEIAGLADTTLVLMAPGMGDGIQAAKAGILEIGDVYVINKADRDGADQVRRELRVDAGAGRAARGRLAPADREDGRRRRARASTRWSRRSTGTTPGWRPRGAGGAGVRGGRATRSRRSPSTALRARWGDVHGRSELDDLAAAVVAGEQRPLRRGRRAARRVRRLRAASRGPPASRVAGADRPYSGSRSVTRGPRQSSCPGVAAPARRRRAYRAPWRGSRRSSSRPTWRASAGSATTPTSAMSLVWPLYGVAVLWLATGDRRTWPWDVLGLVVATATSLAASRRHAAPSGGRRRPRRRRGGAWVRVMRRLAPGLWGSGGDAAAEPAARPRRLPRRQRHERACCSPCCAAPASG